MDIAPTVLDILGIENVQCFDFEGEPILRSVDVMRKTKCH
jgi:arylsulfatase A-like enzyme